MATADSRGPATQASAAPIIYLHVHVHELCTSQPQSVRPRGLKCGVHGRCARVPLLIKTGRTSVKTGLTRVCACSDVELEALLATHGLLDGCLALVAEAVDAEFELR